MGATFAHKQRQDEVFDVIQLQYEPFLRRIITMYESWTYDNTPQTEQQCEEWGVPGQIGDGGGKGGYV